MVFFSRRQVAVVPDSQGAVDGAGGEGGSPPASASIPAAGVPARAYSSRSGNKHARTYDAAKLKADFSAGYPEQWKSPAAFGKANGYPPGTMQYYATRDNWTATVEAYREHKVGEHEDSFVAKVEKYLGDAEQALGFLVKKIRHAARKKIEYDPTDLKRLADASETVNRALRLALDRPTSIVASREFKLVVTREDAPFAQPRRVEPAPVAGGGPSLAQPLQGGERRPTDSQNRSVFEISPHGAGEVPERVGGLVPGADLPAGEGYRVETAHRDPARVDARQNQ
jgi:hypothetical protein